MSRKIRTHVGSPSEMLANPLAPKDMVKQEFGRRLYRLMIAKGWHQSELARQAGIARDSVSVYIRGRALPENENAQALARALGVPFEELLPSRIENAIEEDIPAIEMRVSPQAPHASWLRVNKLVSTKTALKVLQLLEDDKPSIAG